VRDYLADFLAPAGDEVLKSPIPEEYQKAQKPPATFEKPLVGEVSKGSKGAFDTFEPCPHGTLPKLQGVEKAGAPIPGQPSKGVFEGFEGERSQAHASFSPDATPELEAEEFALTSQDITTKVDRPRLGSCARPRVLLGTRMPADCPYHTCNGTMSQRGYTRGQCTLAYCKICDNWFELKPDTPGVYVGDLADNDPLVEVDLHDQKPPQYVRQSVAGKMKHKF